MKKGKAIRQLNSIRKEAEDHLLLDARGGDAADSIWARDIEARPGSRPYPPKGQIAPVGYGGTARCWVRSWT